MESREDAEETFILNIKYEEILRIHFAEDEASIQVLFTAPTPPPLLLVTQLDNSSSAPLLITLIILTNDYFVVLCGFLVF